jgi:hypothetical protein
MQTRGGTTDLLKQADALAGLMGNGDAPGSNGRTR